MRRKQDYAGLGKFCYAEAKGWFLEQGNPSNGAIKRNSRRVVRRTTKQQLRKQFQNGE